jgi:hypothetical protein
MPLLVMHNDLHEVEFAAVFAPMFCIQAALASRRLFYFLSPAFHLSFTFNSIFTSPIPHATASRTRQARSPAVARSL